MFADKEGKSVPKGRLLPDAGRRRKDSLVRQNEFLEVPLKRRTGMQNIMLEACALGLGACWMYQPAFKTQEIHRLFKLSGKVKINSAVLPGYPAEVPLFPGRISIDESILGVL